MSQQKKAQSLTWIEIDLNAIRFNLQQIRQLAAQDRFYLPTRASSRNKPLSRTQILPVIKADAYGHGMEKVAKLLDGEGVGFLGVSDVAEGIRLRQWGIRKPILLFETSLPQSAVDIVDFQLTPTVCTLELAQALQRYAQKKKKRVSIHVKVDTGMGRLGVWYLEAFDFITRVHQLRNLMIHGIYTHFPSADTSNNFTHGQIQKLYQLVIQLDKSGIVIPFIHAANSMGLIGYRTHVLNLTRPGLMLYGLYPDERLKKKLKLKPAMSVKSKIIFIKTIEKGRGVSYGRTFIAKKKTQVATVPVGYSDGYFRCLSGKAQVLIRGKRVAVIGRITMDQIVVDVTSISNLKLGETVTILGQDRGESISAEELAGHAKTINYEIVCSLGNRISRIYK
jgi:alanine racemase